MKGRHAVSVAVALGCTGFFLWLALRRVDFAGLGRAVQAADVLENRFS